MPNPFEIIAPQGINAVNGVAYLPDSPIALIDACKQLFERHEFSQAKKALKEVLAQPEIRENLLQREHNDRVIHIHNQEIEARQVVIAALEQVRAKEIYLKGEGSPMVQALDQQIEQTQGGIDSLQAEANTLSAEITRINNLPDIQKLRPLEARADLGAEVLKRRGDFSVDVAKSGRFGMNQIASVANAVAEVINTVDLTNQVVNLAAGTTTTVSALSSAAPILSGGAQILTGSAQAAVSAASMANNAYHACKDLQRKATAKGVKEGVQNDPQLRAAIERIENKARLNALERSVKTARDGALVITGVATVTAGSALVTSGVLAAASAPGFGAASIPTLALSGAAAGVAVTSGAISAAATAGTAALQIYRHKSSHAAKEVCINSAVGTKALLLTADDGTQYGGKLPSENGQPQKLKDPGIPKEVADAMYKLQQYAIKEGDLSPSEALDVAKLHEYATTRLISLDTREAVAVLSAKLTEECKQAFEKRNGADIVSSDLPVDTPAVQAARDLGMTDREITSLINSFHNEVTNKLALQTLAQKTGMRHGSDTSLTPATEKIHDFLATPIPTQKIKEHLTQAPEKVNGLWNSLKKAFGSDKPAQDSQEKIQADEEAFEKGMQPNNLESFNETEIEDLPQKISFENVRELLHDDHSKHVSHGPQMKMAKPASSGLSASF